MGDGHPLFPVYLCLAVSSNCGGSEVRRCLSYRANLVGLMLLFSGCRRAEYVAIDIGSYGEEEGSQGRWGGVDLISKLGL